MADEHKTGHRARLPADSTETARGGDEPTRGSSPNRSLQSVSSGVHIDGVRLHHRRDVHPVFPSIEHRLENGQVLRTQHPDEATGEWHDAATILHLEVERLGREEEIDRRVVPHQPNLLVAPSVLYVDCRVHDALGQCREHRCRLTGSDEHVDVDVAGASRFLGGVGQRKRATQCPRNPMLVEAEQTATTRSTREIIDGPSPTDAGDMAMRWRAPTRPRACVPARAGVIVGTNSTRKPSAATTRAAASTPGWRRPRSYALNTVTGMPVTAATSACVRPRADGEEFAMWRLRSCANISGFANVSRRSDSYFSFGPNYVGVTIP